MPGGVARGVTRRSGKSLIVKRRLAAHKRLRSMESGHWPAAVQRASRLPGEIPAALRARGHGHARALRSVADRLIAVACAMLTNQTEFASRAVHGMPASGMSDGAGTKPAETTLLGSRTGIRAKLFHSHTLGSFPIPGTCEGDRPSRRPRAAALRRRRRLAGRVRRRWALLEMTVSPDPVRIATEGALWGTICDAGRIAGTVILSGRRAVQRRRPPRALLVPRRAEHRQAERKRPVPA